MGAVDPSREQATAPAGEAPLASLAELFEAVFERGRDVSPRPLSVSQLRAVVALDHHDGVNLRELAEQLHSTPPLVSRLCDRLEAVGFLERLPSARSRRELTLRLSDRGRAYLRDLRARRREHVETLLAKMSPAGRAALAAGLREYRDLADGESAGMP
ncbi:DNA-binding transcriptional regulator, MarR family [Amycolatopsis pretoriensis]|uniref:DNA-binding transcriptional regulator, MarR family n=1 Tax=Amycolatopsis pretoriensis TaxID=218821 RepID=A0A1H5Q257_9PSEU|nr:MarR family transcriptional regulator [Amycolatopsis pretoriensis]SEF20212.1 DNA-binding transcriptional regulator, MarR family [Amycolatopsis pretoriensis]